jgi:hypothetical protein
LRWLRRSIAAGRCLACLTERRGRDLGSRIARQAALPLGLTSVVSHLRRFCHCGKHVRHVGVITGIDAKGNPIMISGNNGNRVREAPVSRGRIYAYVMPTN